MLSIRVDVPKLFRCCSCRHGADAVPQPCPAPARPCIWFSSPSMRIQRLSGQWPSTPARQHLRCNLRRPREHTVPHRLAARLPPPPLGLLHSAAGCGALVAPLAVGAGCQCSGERTIGLWPLGCVGSLLKIRSSCEPATAFFLLVLVPASRAAMEGRTGAGEGQLGRGHWKNTGGSWGELAGSWGGRPTPPIGWLRHCFQFQTLYHVCF
ncbi:hypothetical protein PVAP13_9NG327073 [Panicum virgatum]|uniref:Uncharacterized protein n=1 Tax=Panicum virgatum TaxID=38727 RepID=A0A8T0MLI5_PANVG|nr:hypothetical protein PVAP13_9NG327073 [Panicum virgatum]